MNVFVFLGSLSKVTSVCFRQKELMSVTEVYFQAEKLIPLPLGFAIQLAKKITSNNLAENRA